MVSVLPADDRAQSLTGRRRKHALGLLVALAVIAAVVALSVAVPARPAPPRKPMGTWTEALATRSDEPATLVAVGESTTEGQGASSRDNRWLELLGTHLRAEYPVTGIARGSNYVPATYRVYAPDSTWGTPYSSSSGQITPVYWGGNLGYRAIGLSEQSSATYPVQGESVDLWYFECPGCGPLNYRVDNGAWASVNTDGPYRTDARVENLSLGSLGEHEITVATDSPATAYFGGLTVFDGDRGAGIDVYDASFSGAEVKTYLDDESQFMRSVASAAPDLVTIDLGGNDYFGGTTPALFKLRMQRLVAGLKALPSSPSILLIVPYEPVRPDKLPGNYSRYSKVLHEVAQEDPTYVALLDLSEPAAMGSVAADTSGWYSNDGIHPNDAGHRRFEELVFGAVRT